MCPKQGKVQYSTLLTGFSPILNFVTEMIKFISEVRKVGGGMSDHSSCYLLQGMYMISLLPYKPTLKMLSIIIGKTRYSILTELKYYAKVKFLLHIVQLTENGMTTLL